MDLISLFQQLVGERAAYPLIAIILTIVMQLARKSPYTKPALAKIPDGWRFLVPMITGGALGFIHGYQAGYELVGTLVETVAGIFGVSLISMGMAATLKESPIPWDGGAGGKPKPDPQEDAGTAN